MESNCGLTPYELRVKRNIEENQRVLQSLGLLKPEIERKEVSKKTVRRSNVAVKRKIISKPNEEFPAAFIPARRTRRSSSILKSNGFDESGDVSIDAYDEENTPPQKKKREAPIPVFGQIEGVTVGDWWATRMECSAAGVHRPTVAGIHGKLEDGCYSIALSGGYEDDIDYGECFTYTGSGGRDLKGTKTNPKNLRTAPQTKDQVLEGSNATLALNIENRQPVRVIRGYKLPSPYAPEEGYRYDGLYSVERCWTATGLSGYKVYKFALKRLPYQDSPPWLSNDSNIPAQNGYTNIEPRQNGVQEERHSEEHDNMQTIASDSPPKPTEYLKSSANISSNSIENISENREVMDTNTHTAVKRKRTSSNSKFNLKKTGEESESPGRTQNSTQEDVLEHKDMAQEHSPMKLKRSRRSSDHEFNHEGTGEESKSRTDFENSTQNCFEDIKVSEEHPQPDPKRKRTLSDPKTDMKETEPPITSLKATKNVLEDKNLIENISQMTLERIKSTNKKTNPEKSGEESKSSKQEKLEDLGKKSTLFEKFTELKDSNINEIKNITNLQSKICSANNQQTNNMDNGEVGNDELLPMNHCLQQKLTPLRSGKNNNVNTPQTGKIEQKSTHKLTNSIEKKVRFSPEICFNDEDGNKSTRSISSLDSENKSRARKLNYPNKLCDLIEPNENVYPEGNSLESSLCNSGSDTKKQTSILKYFGPMKKPDVKRPISRGILLRSNRRSFESPKTNNISIPKPMDMKYCTVSLTPVRPTSQYKSELLKSPIENKSTQRKDVKSLSNRRKVCDKTETELFHMYDSTNNSVKNQNSLLSTVTMSPIKPCSVVLVKVDDEQRSSPSKSIFVSIDKLEDSFLGWDYDLDEVEFIGFDLDQENHLLFYGFEEESPKLLRDLEFVRPMVRILSVIENLGVSNV